MQIKQTEPPHGTTLTAQNDELQPKLRDSEGVFWKRGPGGSNYGKHFLRQPFCAFSIGSWFPRFNPDYNPTDQPACQRITAGVKLPGKMLNSSCKSFGFRRQLQKSFAGVGCPLLASGGSNNHQLGFLEKGTLLEVYSRLPTPSGALLTGIVSLS